MACERLPSGYANHQGPLIRLGINDELMDRYVCQCCRSILFAESPVVAEVRTLQQRGLTLTEAARWVARC